MIYDLKGMEPLARKAGIQDVRSFSRRFLPSLILPLLVAMFNPLLALILTLGVLRLPHLWLWYAAKERRKRVREELPLFVASLKWMLGVYPVQKALCLTRFGEVSKVFKEFCSRYSKGESFESAIFSCAIFPELEELARRLVVVYRTGGGVKLLDLYANRLQSENLSRIRSSAARMQLFAVAYTALVAILPAMYSGLSLYSTAGNVLPFSFIAGSSLVVLWRLID